MRTRRRSQLPISQSRRGVVALELLCLLPLLIILLLAVVEFGLIFTASQHVEMSARLGAKAAAETNNLGMFNDPATPNNLKDRVDQYLNTAGYTDSCQVTLEHTVSGVLNPIQHNPPSCPCPCVPVIGPIGSLPPQAVRVTVCLPMTGNVPNCLSSFGFDLSACTVRHSVVWIYEL